MLKRIYLLVAAVTFIAVLITGFVAFDVVSQYNDQAAHRYLESMSRLAEKYIAEGSDVKIAADSSVAVFSNSTADLRITIVKRDGTVAYDNQADAAGMDNHSDRPEIAYAARTGEIGSAIRSSDTIGQDMLYLALPTDELIIRTSMPLNAHKSALYSLVRTSVIVLLLVIAVLALTGLILVKYITRPLKDLHETAIAMRDGDLSARVLIPDDDSNEMSSLALTYNSMAEKLENTLEELADRKARLDAILDSIVDPVLAVGERCAVTFMNAHAKNVFGRNIDPEQAVYPLVLITHSQATEELAEEAMETSTTVSEELRIKSEDGEKFYHVIASPIRAGSKDGAIITFHDISQARLAQKMRSDFVANVTHELRTPLTSIRGFVETLRNGAVNKPDVANRFLEIIDIEAERLHQLINDILILAESEQQNSAVESERFDLNELIDDVAVLLDDIASEKRVSIAVEQDEGDLLVSASRNRIKQILLNLTENAIKYNNEGGHVYISACRTAEDEIKIVVRDDGPGIAKEHQERIFERFYRVDRSHSRDAGGTGLGLAIVKHIAQLYQGKAEVRSNPGEGSEFTVTLAI
jgi:two-component system phosphate regulon sensor histidine kinase PhoR